MFSTAELGQKIPKSEYKARVPLLRQQLLEVQQELLREKGFPVILVFAGVDGAGKGATVNLLNEWMDPRWLVTRAYGEPSDEECERPEYWRFWRDLPPRGQIGLFLSCWYSQPILDRVYEVTSEAEFDEQLNRIIAFEKALTDDGALILKFWMHLSKGAQKRRLKSLERDPLLSWQVTEKDWEHWRLYDRFVVAAEHNIMRTNTGQARWFLVEGADANYRGLTVGHIILDAVRQRLEEYRLQAKLKSELHAKTAAVREGVTDTEPAEAGLPPSSLTVLSALDMSHALGKAEYKRQLKLQQGRLNLLHRRAKEQGLSTILVFEGPDAAGKGGAIRRLTAAMEARNYQVLPFAAPTDEEQAHHYLWRFWRNLPRAGRVTIFDRSWYGRVLVERVEGYALEEEWRRAYAEINDFEAQLIERGMVLLKFWIHITKDEQLARFKSREQIPHKRWKLTEDDWRNREKWELYEQAVNDMVELTSTAKAPWRLVEGNNKLFARIKVLETVCNQLEQALKKK